MFQARQVVLEDQELARKFISASFYEADIVCYGILSYSWLETNQIAIFPHRNCLMLEGREFSYWRFGGELEEAIRGWDTLEIPRPR